ncbi:MAG: hypothetical protein RJB38_1311 [Pseudomonadota bacterium]|jgi:trehalose 6-phosphate synthase
METPQPLPLVILANREPYIHVHTPCGIETRRPASGLVSALEPVMQQKGGYWIAQGCGSADVETADRHGMIAVPPHDPTYQLKRVWLSPSEKKAYYDGFSNEALWPLFHLAHQQPIFRSSDWETYRRVNELFSRSLPHESLKAPHIFLVQDFHLALVPSLLRQNTSLTDHHQIAMVWHIPWVPSEVFRICPWATEILEGMLGADLISFHTQAYCNNFLESCERLLESRVDYARHSVTLRGHETRVRAIPLGISPEPIERLSKTEIQRFLAQEFGISPAVLGLGVDRMDYTKGILERFAALERFFELEPESLGVFSFLQIASPSRTEVPAYQEFTEKVIREAKRINHRFEGQFPATTPPIQLIHRQCDWNELGRLYQAAQICVVSPLHDGMNLVAQEYLWARSADDGALILSRFAGASQSLPQAFLVNPYDTEDLAQSLRSAHRLALRPPTPEHQARMNLLREKVGQRTSLVWAQELLNELTAV